MYRFIKFFSSHLLFILIPVQLLQAQVSFKTGVQLGMNLSHANIYSNMAREIDTMDASYSLPFRPGYQFGISLALQVKGRYELKTGLLGGRSGYNVRLKYYHAKVKSYIMNRTTTIPVILSAGLSSPESKMAIKVFAGMTFDWNLLLVTGQSWHSNGSLVEVYISYPEGLNVTLFSKNIIAGIGVIIKRNIEVGLSYRVGLNPLHRIKITNDVTVNGAVKPKYYANIQPKLNQIELNVVYYFWKIPTSPRSPPVSLISD